MATSKTDAPNEAPKSPLIRTTYVFPPIPVRFLDWQAHYDGEEDEQMDVGTGATEEEAIRELMENHPRNGNPCRRCGEPFFFEGETRPPGGCQCGHD